jgi:hypothetical protein
MVLNFEVAPSSITLGKSSSRIPFPLSFTFINFLPPLRVSISILLALASKEFSINSFTTLEGSSIISPA